MARTLEQLQKQYNSAAKTLKPGMPPMGPRGGGHRGAGMSGKPKDTRKTLKRLLGYIRPYTGRFVGVLVCMLISTVNSLIGAYMLAPIINRLTLAVMPNTPVEISAAEQVADSVISRVANVLGNTWRFTQLRES